MPGRTYNPHYQAECSERLRNHDDEVWSSFHRHWVAFNALYNVSRGQERNRVRSTITKFMAECVDKEWIDKLTEDIPDPPPGNTRYESSNEEFRKKSFEEVKKAKDTTQPSSHRLASIMVLVYQVRCSLVHGNKNPDWDRDNVLVEWGDTALRDVLPKLERAMSEWDG